MGVASVFNVLTLHQQSTNRYYSTGENYQTAMLMVTFVLLSLGLQIFQVVAVHHSNKRKLMIELVGTLTFTKPAFNKWRVLTNAKTEGHEIIPPVTEFIYFKVCEVFAESIPVTVLQVNTILTSEKVRLRIKAQRGIWRHMNLRTPAGALRPSVDF